MRLRKKLMELQNCNKVDTKFKNLEKFKFVLAYL